MENYFESQRENIFQHCEAELDDVGGHTFRHDLPAVRILIEATTLMSGFKLMVDVENHMGDPTYE